MDSALIQQLGLLVALTGMWEGDKRADALTVDAGSSRQAPALSIGTHKE